MLNVPQLAPVMVKSTVTLSAEDPVTGVTTAVTVLAPATTTGDEALSPSSTLVGLAVTVTMLAELLSMRP